MIIYPMIKILFTAYIELGVPVLLNTIAILSCMDAPTVYSWFQTGSDAFCSTLTLFLFSIIITLPHASQKLMALKGKLALSEY